MGILFIKSNSHSPEAGGSDSHCLGITCHIYQGRGAGNWLHSS